MLRIGHYGIAMLAYAPIAARFVRIDARLPVLIGLPIVLLAARLPDVDRRLPFVTHRGVTHTLWFVSLLPLALVSVVATSLAPAAIERSVWFLSVGYIPALLGGVSHLVADSLTPMGIRPLWPVSNRRFAAGLVRSGDTSINYLLFFCGIAAIAITLYSTRL